MKDDGLAVFVINMSSSTSRLIKITHELNAQNISFERIEGIDGGKLADPRKFTSLFSRLIRPIPLSPSEVGCWLSHRKVWEKIIAEKIMLALILEDDATPRARLEDLASIDLNHSQLDLLRVHILRPDAALVKKRIKKIDTGICIADREIFVQTAPVLSATAYFVTLAGAQKLAARKKMLAPIDWFSLPGGLDGLRHGIVLPGMFDAEDGGVSTICGHGMVRKTGNGWRIRLKRMHSKLVKRVFLCYLDRRNAEHLVGKKSADGPRG